MGASSWPRAWWRPSTRPRSWRRPRRRPASSCLSGGARERSRAQRTLSSRRPRARDVATAHAKMLRGLALGLASGLLFGSVNVAARALQLQPLLLATVSYLAVGVV